MPTPILGQPEATAFQLKNFLHKVNPGAPDYSLLYLSLGRKYGVRGDIAFCQSILETNYWRFGGSVTAGQYNFAGLGATAGSRGASFPTPEAGIEAQMQHLYAYATSTPLPANTVQIDPRFHLVDRGCCPYWENLSGHWASDPKYGEKILNLWNQLKASQAVLLPTLPGNNPVPPPPSTTEPLPAPPSPVPDNGASLPADVSPTAWYAPYVERAIRLGIMRGTDDDRFEPDRPATRAELAAALYNLYTLLRDERV